MRPISDPWLDIGGGDPHPERTVSPRPTCLAVATARHEGQGVCAFTFGYRYFAGFLREDG